MIIRGIVWGIAFSENSSVSSGVKVVWSLDVRLLTLEDAPRNLPNSGWLLGEGNRFEAPKLAKAVYIDLEAPGQDKLRPFHRVTYLAHQPCRTQQLT